MKSRSNFIIICIIIIPVQSINTLQTISSPTPLSLSQSESSYKTMDVSNTLPANYNFEVNYTHLSYIIDQVLPITSIITPAYTILVLDTQGNWNNFGQAFGYIYLQVNMTVNHFHQIQTLSMNDYSEDQSYYHQIYFDYNNIEIDPASHLEINFTLIISNSYLTQDTFIRMIISHIYFYTITPPVTDPVIIAPTQHAPTITTINGINILNTNLLNIPYTIDYLVFLPVHSGINFTLTTTAPIKIYKVSCDNAQWVNLPNLTLSSTNFTFSFITNDNDNINPRILEMSYYPQTTDYVVIPELIMTVIGEVVVLKTIIPIPNITTNEFMILNGISLIIGGGPIVIITKNRKKKIIKLLKNG